MLAVSPLTSLRRPTRACRVKGQSDAKTVATIVEKDWARRRRQQPAEQHKWLTVVADEAHFMRNPVANWGLLMVTLGTHTTRMILATGASAPPLCECAPHGRSSAPSHHC